MAITFVGASSVAANAGASWSPATVSRSGVTANDLLVTIGGWWDAITNTSGLTPLPAASNGQLIGLMRQRNPGNDANPGWPVSSQIAGILGCNAGTHVFTPPPVQTNGGDGSFLALQFTCGGPGFLWRLITQGSAVTGSGTPGGVTNVTVTTDDATARVGDLIVAACASDGNPNTIAIGGPTSGSYTQTSSMSASATTVPVGSGYKIVTADGAQTATWAPTADGQSQIFSATIAVFRATAIDGGQRYFRPQASGLYLLDTGDGDFPAELLLKRWF